MSHPRENLEIPKKSDLGPNPSVCLRKMSLFNLENIESLMRTALEELEIKTKVGFQSTRVAITGTKISPPLFESIFALGKETCIARLTESIEKLTN